MIKIKHNKDKVKMGNVIDIDIRQKENIVKKELLMNLL